MKTSVLATAAFIAALTAGSAIAADLPSRRLPLLPPPPPPPLWSGFYLGFNAGATFGGGPTHTTAVPGVAAAAWGANLATSAALTTGSYPADDARFLGGGQIGYNFQFGSSWVIGLEADIQGVAGSRSTAKSSSIGVPAGVLEFITSDTNAAKTLDYLGTVRGRIGLLATPTLLLYATGGLAYGDVGSSVSISQANLPFAPSFASFGRYSDLRVGWTAGGGLEWLLAPKWSVKLEYLYYDLGSVNYALSTLSFPGFYASTPFAKTRFDGHVARIGLNYHFNWSEPAPVMAKY
ncbi:outer membrane protein [Methylosinus sp. Sm6]|uniref:outer membrane protein n=1 Tax=Methylosinus sp. Sm6 TaxID=2866948 RepID=UPI001C9A26FE|nr:outer membrane beta-barrel protein [Methylosinus sp. Sm6]MBY6240237.1 outer membrane beta-barrel protein [Methylosinus sp. Sm6]